MAVVLGPVLLGSFFVGMTVATVSQDRTVERLDHAATTVRTAVGAMCRQLQAAADAVAVLPEEARRPAADQLVTRGLASEIRIGPEGSADQRDCAAPAAGGSVTAIVARARQGEITVSAAQRLDAGFVNRLAASSGAEVTLLAGDSPGAGPALSSETDRVSRRVAAALPGSMTRRGHHHVRGIPAEPGQPLPLAVSVPSSDPMSLYAFLLGGVVIVACGAIVVARRLARSTTRPLEELVWAVGKVADGELGTRVPVGRDDELGKLAGTFNRMTRELQSYVQALTASRDQLRGHLAILGDTLSSTHDLHRILQVILQTALSATGARAGIVLLLDPVDGRLVARCAEGLTGRWDVPEADLPALRMTPGAGVLGAVAATGEPRRGSFGPGAGALDEPACRTYVAVPICAPATVGDPLVPGDALVSGQPATLGVLALYDRLGGDEFDDADLLTLRTFAGQAGVAVHNVRVHEEAQRLSLTDPLTGLWNYRYLRESLRREVERASRFGRMLTVLVLDLDHFKAVNDTYGHAAGDTVLGEFARRIRIGLREVDVAFRQGGEEFVVLLPETDAYGGVIVAERLGAAVRDIPVPIDPRRQDSVTGLPLDRVSISVSIGIAVYPEHGTTAQQVLDAADDALYAAKNAGRDTYRLAESVPLPATGVTETAVSAGVPEGQFDQTAGPDVSSGGPQPPRQGRGR
ncbi:putative diguanylate cyclase with GAF sensor [Actinoplanes friuliensis DSM 7358]|uniref:Putative diguanylate cyclase with GAF sensor n=1 Tax=Actinoplanes friuliensis DSM 7358 TaxID=1246995 RepID=U5WDY7_9ACTN|nr:putative diguanylate cyclase with GAF sensor [Actinoplanes friuliensis DSM 7358]